MSFFETPDFGRLACDKSPLNLSAKKSSLLTATARACCRSLVVLIYSAMQKGFNSDVNVRGQRYHVQTEDWGFQNPYLVSRVFLQGAVVRTIKTSYQEFVKAPVSNGQYEVIQRALRQQHTLVVEKLVSGELA